MKTIKAWFKAGLAIWTLGVVSLGSLQAQFVSDDFSGASLNAVWTITSPNPASSVGLTGTGALRLTASPDNGGSDLGGANYNAPRVLQGTGGAADWVIETRFDFLPTTDYQGAGLLLKIGPGDNDLWRIAERAYYPGGGGSVVRSVGGYVAYAGATTWLRVQKLGNDYTGWWSSDGVTWILSGTATDAATVNSFGVFAISQPWAGPPPSVADFDYFTAIPEPSTSAAVLAGVALGLVWLRRRPRAAPCPQTGQ